MRYWFYILLIILSFNSDICYSQDNSILYNSQRRLISDTSIYLDTEQFQIWINIEEDLLSSFFNQFNTPQFYLDAGIEFSWIFSFQYDTLTNQFDNIYIHKQLHSKSWPNFKVQNQIITDSVKVALNNLKYRNILQDLKDSKPNFVYYLPIVLDVKRVIERTNINGVLKVYSTSPGLIKSDVKVH